MLSGWGPFIIATALHQSLPSKVITEFPVEAEVKRHRKGEKCREYYNDLQYRTELFHIHDILWGI